VTPACGASLPYRYYDPATGQFLSVDPLVDETGTPYAYAGGDPVKQTDPSGLGDGNGECNDQPDTCEGIGPGGVNMLNPADQYYNATNAADETEEANLLTQEQQAIADQEKAASEQSVEAEGPTGTGQECLLSRDGEGVNVTDSEEAGEDNVERVYEPNPKHGSEPYRDSHGRVVSKPGSTERPRPIVSVALSRLGRH
jgi:uncharacterized protein RhaS with RHS repeats